MAALDGIGVLAFGPVGDLLAVQRAKHRAHIDRQQRALTPQLSRRIESYARVLAHLYPFYGSGADAGDVEQEALLAAWAATSSWRPDGLGLEAWVRKNMRWRVLDFVGVSSRQDAAERFSAALPDNI
jgi:DNA-directed RNA polymerase specialized sigma24 family protein